MLYHYFVSYCVRDDTGFTFGRCSVACYKPITSMDNIEDVEIAIMAENGFDEHPAVLGFQLLREEDDDA